MFVERIRKAVSETGATLCVGLDPHLSRLPAGVDATPEGVRGFLFRIIDQTYESAAVYKPNSAFFECLGPGGMEVLGDVIRHAHEAHRPVILDAKRCDIASTAAAYAQAAFTHLGADALTIVPYTGEDTVLPFVDAGGFVFLLALPSNPGAAAIVRHGNPPLYLRVAELGQQISSQYPDQVGLVVGATDPQAAKAVADTGDGMPWLVPGIGAQGGDLSAFCSTVGDGQMLIFNASRSVIFADDPGEAARQLRGRIQRECTDA